MIRVTLGMTNLLRKLTNMFQTNWVNFLNKFIIPDVTLVSDDNPWILWNPTVKDFSEYGKAKSVAEYL